MNYARILTIGTLTLSALAPSALAAHVHGSIRLAKPPAHETAAQEAQEIKQLTPLARISRARAAAAAQRVAKGKLRSIEIDNEDGYLVYSVNVGRREVLVDAGNGKVLANEPSDD